MEDKKLKLKKFKKDSFVNFTKDDKYFSDGNVAYNTQYVLADCSKCGSNKPENFSNLLYSTLDLYKSKDIKIIDTKREYSLKTNKKKKVCVFREFEALNKEEYKKPIYLNINELLPKPWNNLEFYISKKYCYKTTNPISVYYNNNFIGLICPVDIIDITKYECIKKDNQVGK